MVTTIRETNEHVLSVSWLTVAVYLTRVPTVGVVSEMDKCCRDGIPLVIVTDSKPGVYLRSMVPDQSQIVVATELASVDVNELETVQNVDAFTFMSKAIGTAIGEDDE